MQNQSNISNRPINLENFSSNEGINYLYGSFVPELNSAQTFKSINKIHNTFISDNNEIEQRYNLVNTFTKSLSEIERSNIINNSVAILFDKPLQLDKDNISTKNTLNDVFLPNHFQSTKLSTVYYDPAATENLVPLTIIEDLKENFTSLSKNFNKNHKFYLASNEKTFDNSSIWSTIETSLIKSCKLNIFEEQIEWNGFVETLLGEFSLSTNSFTYFLPHSNNLVDYILTKFVVSSFSPLDKYYCHILLAIIQLNSTIRLNNINRNSKKFYHQFFLVIFNSGFYVTLYKFDSPIIIGVINLSLNLNSWSYYEIKTDY